MSSWEGDPISENMIATNSSFKKWYDLEFGV